MRRQIVEIPGEALSQVAGLKDFIGEHCILVGEFDRSIVIVSLQRLYRDLARVSPSSLLPAVHADIPRDAVQPGVELRVAAKAFERSIRAQETLLRQVLDVASIAHEAPCQAEHRILVPLDQYPERSAIALKRAVDQFGVGCGHRHLRKCSPCSASQTTGA